MGKGRGMKYFILVLGCQMNHSDSERLVSVFSQMGFDQTDREEEADILGVLACSVRQRAIDKVHGRIHRWNKWKESRPLISFVTGCLLEEDRTTFLRTFDLVFDAKDIAALPQMINQYGVVTPLQARRQQGEFWGINPCYSSSFEAFIPIQNGCNKFCTFCAVPYTRGREESRPSKEILAELDGLLAKGYKSITLLGQNVNSYGLDKKGGELNFAALLEEIGKRGSPGGQDFWLYFTSPHPRDMGLDVLEVMARYPVLAKQIHLPLQSGDDFVLRRMNRNHSLADFRKIVHNIRRLLGNATLFTDIIVGFPSEGEEEFENTREALREFSFNMAYIAAYSPRPGAKSAGWGDWVPLGEKKRRFHDLSAIFTASAREYNQALVGRNLRVLVTGKEGEICKGYNEGKINIHFEGTASVGSFCQVEVQDLAGLSLKGRQLS